MNLAALLDPICNYLKNTPFEGRSFYGETFALALFRLRGENPPTDLVKRFQSLDQNDPSFHWEFNRYALCHLTDKQFEPFVRHGQWRNNPCTNWQLLRCNVETRIEIDGTKRAKQVLCKAQQTNGLIQDSPEVNSFQYHAFSLALVGELYEQTKDPFFLESFKKGLNFIRPFILSNGDTLYIGRGQEQIFGYGALIYALTQGLLFCHDNTIAADLERVIAFVTSFLREDGSLPLVLRRTAEGGPSSKVNLFDEKYYGWYGYNNYFDYLPFFAFFLQKAQDKLPDVSISKHISSNYSDSSFLKIAKPSYDAVISKPKGYLTNDLSFPYIVANGKTITPCFGGEQFIPSPYRHEDLPLPFFPKIGKTLRSKSVSLLKSNILWMGSPLGGMRREFFFLDNEVKVTTSVFSPFSCMQQALFFENIQQTDPYTLVGNDYEVTSTAPLTFLRHAASPLGKLSVFGSPKKKLTLAIKLHLKQDSRVDKKPFCSNVK